MPRNIALFTLILLALANAISAQPPQIPGIQQQPQWAMPFFFEDANGDKDTVWIGYDKTAKKNPGEFDSIYNEYQWIDTSKFVAILNYGSPSPNMTNPPDSAYKIEISSWYYPGTQVSFINGKMPITMKWVDSLFNSDSLPYPDISPRPRARANMTCLNGEAGYSYCYLGSHHYAYLLTGYYHPQWSYPYVYADSFVFEGSGNMLPEYAILINLQIVPHNDPIPTGIKDSDSKELAFKLSPNPADNYIAIATPLQGLYDLHIYAMDGRLMKSRFGIDKPIITMDVSSLPKGIYVVRIEDGTSVGHRKFITR